MDTNLSDHFGYKPYSDYLSGADPRIFKINYSGFNYMLEHFTLDQIPLGKQWYDKIFEMKLLSKKNFDELINLNDRYGHTCVAQIYDVICSTNTLKYIYHALLIAVDIKKLEKPLDIIEIGGGYGGLCIILHKIFEMLNIQLNRYILIDLPNVVAFQKKYIELNCYGSKCVYLSSDTYDSYTYENDSYIFSSYSLSELSTKVKEKYFDDFKLMKIKHGFIVWNGPVIDIPSHVPFSVENEAPLTSIGNKFIYLSTYNSQAGQDRFVLSALQNKQNGTFLEIGSNDSIFINNTYILETLYKWSGIMVEYDEKFLCSYETLRKNSIHVIQDATTIDYKQLLHDFPVNIDYLQIDLEVRNRSTLTVLEMLDKDVFNEHKFAVVTFEHDIYNGDYFGTRDASRKIFEKHGYILTCPDVRDKNLPFEDWYVYPSLVDMEFINKIKHTQSLEWIDIIKKFN